MLSVRHRARSQKSVDTWGNQPLLVMCGHHLTLAEFPHISSQILNQAIRKWIASQVGASSQPQKALCPGNLAALIQVILVVDMSNWANTGICMWAVLEVGRVFVAVSLFLENCGVFSPPCGQEQSTGSRDPKVKQDTFSWSPCQGLTREMCPWLEMTKCPKAPWLRPGRKNLELRAGKVWV